MSNPLPVSLLGRVVSRRESGFCCAVFSRRTRTVRGGTEADEVLRWIGGPLLCRGRCEAISIRRLVPRAATQSARSFV